jgi:prepilin-type N-terminal cleavage/methylation domain-containing protein/prepilin-type processing-associated H-X9-DG protein
MSNLQKYSSPTSRISISPRDRRQSAFTLVELLVVIAIIGVLVALLLPAVQAAREAARRTQCTNRFKQTALALHNYHDAQKSLPPGMIMFSTARVTQCGTPSKNWTGFGWGAMILPFLEESTAHEQIDFTEPYGAGGPNRLAEAQFIDSFLCPSDPQGKELVTCCGAGQVGPNPLEDMGLTNQAGVADSRNWKCPGVTWALPLGRVDGVMANGFGCRMKKVTDGTSQTLMISEITGRGPGTHFAQFWATWNVVDASGGINGGTTAIGGSTTVTIYTTAFSSYHPGGCHFAFVDGSVHFLNEDIDQPVLEALTTRANGDIVGNIAN